MNRYKTTCSCCGYTVTKKDRELPDNNDNEGNLCGTCYGEQQLHAWFQRQEMFDLVYNALKKPINKVKWKYKEPYLKWYHCTELMKKGILNWQI